MEPRAAHRKVVIGNKEAAASMPEAAGYLTNTKCLQKVYGATSTSR